MAAPGSAHQHSGENTYTHIATVSGDTSLSPACKAVYVGGAGTLDITANGTTITCTVAAGAILPIRCSNLNPGTATNVVALW